MLEPDILKSEPLDIPLKKSKLDEYTAYIYAAAAAAIDPLYMHAAIYEQYNRQISAFRPVPNLFAKEGKTRHVPSTVGRYKEPPILQNPERVVSISESEKFERTFQPNVALAPPKKHKYKDLDINAEDYTKKEIIDDPPRLGDSTVIKSDKDYSRVIKTEPVERTHSAIVDSTVSVVQSTAQQRYNSEIELSTDTDDSLSDTSGDNLRKISDVTRIADALNDAPDELRERVMDLVRNMAKEHSQQCQEKDERIRELEQRLRDLQNNTRQQPEDLIDSGSRQSEYDVSSSRAEIPVDETEECEQNDNKELEVVTSCGTSEPSPTPLTDTAIVRDDKDSRINENNNSVILAISPNASEKLPDTDVHE